MDAIRSLIIASGAVSRIGERFELERLSGGSGRVVALARSDRGRFIVRMAADGEDPKALEVERRAAECMRSLAIDVPDIQLFEADAGRLSVHPRVEGETFYALHPDRFGGDAPAHFVEDGARLLRDLHTTPLADAATALYGDWPGSAEALRRWAHPHWFDAERIEAAIGARLDESPPLGTRWRDVRAFFASLAPTADDLVFGHGDLHGDNLAFQRQGDTWRLHGIFDLGNAGLMHRCDELLRIVLLSRSLGVEIVARYDALRPESPPTDRAALLAFYHAFLFFLLHQASEGAYADHVVALLCEEIPALAGE